MTANSKESTGAGAETALSRWSRRKLETQQAEVRGEPPAPPVAADEPPATAAEADRPLLTDADMPDLDSLGEASDFSPFMSPGVSDELRNLALRKLFRAPLFNIRDGLDEYDEDYTSFEKLGNIVTADMKHQLEMQQQKLREKLAEQGETVADADLEGVETIDDEPDAPETAGEEDAATDAQSTTLAAADHDPRQEPKPTNE